MSECRPCKERGRPGIVAHRIVNGELMCDACFRGQIGGAKEKLLPNPCKCGCGETAAKNRFYKRGHKPKGKSAKRTNERTNLPLEARGQWRELWHILNDLRRWREHMNTAIAALEALEK